NLFATRQAFRLGRRVVSVALACLLGIAVFFGAVIFLAWGIADLTSAHDHSLSAVWKVLVGLLLPAVFKVFQPMLLGWVGDAARYCGRSPDNPIERQQIRAEGIKLLDRLHTQLDSKKNLEYERIVLVGHSLGSVIAYDLLTNYWTSVNTKLRIAPQ